MGCAHGGPLRFALRCESLSLDIVSRSIQQPLGLPNIRQPFPVPTQRYNVRRRANTSPSTQGGRFHIVITLPKEYPFKPPTLSFRTKIYHPNVSNDERGAMCLGMLKSEEWKPPNKIKEVLSLVRATLSEPQPDDAVEPSIADNFKNNNADFQKQAKEWVKKYAS